MSLLYMVYYTIYTFVVGDNKPAVSSMKYWGDFTTLNAHAEYEDNDSCGPLTSTNNNSQFLWSRIFNVIFIIFVIFDFLHKL